MKKITIAVLSLFAVASLAFGQVQATSTTLAVAMSRGDTSVNLTSATGVTQATTSPSTGLYIDREYLTVTTLVNGTTYNVKRGVAGIQTPHAANAVVWVGPPGAFDLGPNDRVGACTGSFFVIQVRSGNATYCSNGEYGNFTTNPQVGSVLASQAGVMTGAFQIYAKITHISGTAAITGIAIPPGLCDGCNFVTIPDAAWTWTAATNLVSTGTAVAGKAITWTYDRTAGKLYPSY